MILFDKPITKQDLYVYVHVPSTAEAARASTSWGRGGGGGGVQFRKGTLCIIFFIFLFI